MSPGPRHDAAPAAVVVCSAGMDAKNKLYFGDNLRILRDYVGDASVDLVGCSVVCVCLPPVRMDSPHGLRQ